MRQTTDSFLKKEYGLYTKMFDKERTFGLLIFTFATHPVKEDVIIMELLGSDIDVTINGCTTGVEKSAAHTEGILFHEKPDYDYY